MYKIRCNSQINKIKWNNFVEKSSQTDIFNLFEWKKVIYDSYKIKSLFISIESKNNIVGILPLYFFGNNFFRDKLISSPFVPNSGPVSLNPLVEKLLIDLAIKKSTHYSASYLEIRKHLNDDRFIIKNNYINSFLKLKNDSDSTFDNFKPRKKNYIRKSLKKGFTNEWTDDISSFYKIYSNRMKELGSPCHSEYFFEKLLQTFSDKVSIQLVKKESELLYVAFYFIYKDRMVNCWSSSLHKNRKLRVSDFAIWQAILRAISENLKEYDFGRSNKSSGNLAFKRDWGAQDRDLFYSYYTSDIKNIPDITSRNPNRIIFSTFWKSLPNILVNRLGPIIRSNFP